MKKLFALILSVCLLMGVCAAAFAEKIPDPEALKEQFRIGDFGDEDLEDIVAELLYYEATDDDNYDDLRLALGIADALENGDADLDDVIMNVVALAYYDANPEGEDEDVEAALELLEYIVDDEEAYKQYENDIKKFRKNLRSDVYGEMNALIQDLLLEELMDNDDQSDVQVLLQIIHFFLNDEHRQWDNARALVLLAVLDSLDDDSGEDLKLLGAYARAAIDENLYLGFVKTFENITDFLTNGQFDDIDHMILQLAVLNFLDDDNISDYETVLEIFDAAADGNPDAFTGLIIGALINDYYDNYIDEDFELMLEYIRQFDNESDESYGLYEKAVNILEQLEYSMYDDED